MKLSEKILKIADLLAKGSLPSKMVKELNEIQKKLNRDLDILAEKYGYEQREFTVIQRGKFLLKSDIYKD